MYKIRRDGEGRLVLILRESDNGFVLQDDTNSDYQAFKTWAAAQDPPVDISKYVFPPEHKLFRERREFVQYCKDTGFRLMAFRNELPSEYTISTASSEPTDNYGQGRMYRLSGAATAKPGTFGEVPGVDGIAGSDSHVWVSEGLFNDLASELRSDREDDVRRISTITLHRAFVYIDVSDYSKMPAGHQALVVNSLIQILSWTPYWNVPKSFEARMCIGDGFIFVFRSAFAATLFAAKLARLIDVSVAKRLVPVEFHFRMGVHSGPVYCFWDEGRNGWNYIGEGINGGNRVVSAIGKDADDVVFISGQVRSEIIEKNDATAQYRAVLSNLINRGRRADKHDKLWRVFEVAYNACTDLHPDFGQ